MNTPRLLTSLAVLIATTGCMSTQMLRQANENLTLELDKSRAQTAHLEASNQQLTAEVNRLTKLTAVLRDEKHARTMEATATRHDARGFVQLQMQALRRFATNQNLLDYVGSELIRRNNTDPQPMLLIDLEHPLPAAGTLTTGRLYAQRTGTVVFCLLRRHQRNLAVVWQSDPLQVPKTGVNDLAFPVPIGCLKGDLIAIRCRDANLLLYDIGTGQVATWAGAAAPGTELTRAELGEPLPRAYSFGAAGFLQ